MLVAKLGAYEPSNAEKATYYEAEMRVRMMGLAIPQEVANRVMPVVGWGGTVVDVLEERLDWWGWAETQGDDLGLADLYADNALDVESGPGHLDALLYGTAFVRVGSGDEGEASPLITLHSPRTTTGVRDMRTRRLSSALTVTAEKDGEAREVVLDVLGQTITARKAQGQWIVADRDEHDLPRIPVAQLTNRPRSSRSDGRSEITRAVRYYCDAAVRTVLGMEGNREFYGIPQLMLLGRGPEAFQDANGNPTSGWKIVSGHALAIDKDEDGDTPSVHQTTVGSPQPFIEQVRGWATLLAAEAAMPASYLGFQTDNPASADAIRAGEARLVKRAERRQTSFGRTWLEVARLALLVRDGEVPEDFNRRVANRWRDAATPTRAAAADETTKYVSAGVLPPDSTVTYDRMGLTPSEQRQLDADKRRATGLASLTALGVVGDAAAASEDAAAIKAKADAMGVLIRAGVDPENAAAQVGLSGVAFTGAVPVSLRLPETQAAKVEDK